MCEPTTIALVAGMVITAAAGYQEGQVQKRAGENQAAIAENNARLAEEQGKDAAILGARESQQAAWRSRAVLGAQRAAVAANGVDSELGTAFDLGAEAAMFGGADQSAIAVDAQRKAWGFGAEALNYRNQGATARWMGKAQSQVTYLRTLGSVVSMGSGLMGAGSKAATTGSYARAGATTSGGHSWQNAYGATARGRGPNYGWGG